MAKAVAAAGLAALVAGCSTGSGIPYPSLPPLPSTASSTEGQQTLTPEQQKGAIDELASAQAANAAAADGKTPAKKPFPPPEETAPLPE